MAYRIAICDDEEEQIQILDSMLSNWARQSGLTLDLCRFPSAEAFLFAYEEDSAYDILILDIEMKGISGIQLARRIRADDSRVQILFITSHFEFISEGYDVDALHYLTKPVLEDKLVAVLSKAVDRLSIEPPSLIINCEGETIKLYETDILYVESFLHYISIHTAAPRASGAATAAVQGNPENRPPTLPRPQEYKIKESISAFEKKLSADFFRIHRSYLVSLKHITRISRTSVILDGKTELPLARGKYDAINEAFIQRN